MRDPIGFATFAKNRIMCGRFCYTKENGKRIAPCGGTKRCKNLRRRCEEYDWCDRIHNCREKADYRLFLESFLHDWKKKPKRRRQMMRWWEYEHRVVGAMCRDCKEETCAENGVRNPKCLILKWLGGADGVKS